MTHVAAGPPPMSPPSSGASCCLEVGVPPTMDEVDEALTHASTSPRRDWDWIDALLDARLAATT